tara:strand:- start:581 stop:1051 length:471 start_codon:yes stop_codon:yes gene_type:complete
MIYIKANDNSFVTNIIYNILLDRNVYDIIPPITWSWLMIFTNDFTKEKFTVIQIMHQSAVTSVEGSNLVVFPIVARVKAGVDSKGFLQEIAFDNYGYYSYDIYYQDNLTNLSAEVAYASGKQNLVQTGKALISKENEVIDYAAQKDGNPNNFIYVP